MSKKIDRAAEHALAEVRMAEARIAALHFALSKFRNNGFPMSAEAKQEFSALHALLFADLNECYRSLLMWAGLIGGETLKVTNKMALDRYLTEQSAIMHYLGFDGSYPVLEETLFRKEIAELREG